MKRKPAPRPQPPPETEGEFRAKVLQLAALCGWRFVHFRAARTLDGWRTAMEGHRGFPDVVLVRRGVLIFAELKSEDGRYRAGQKEWLADLKAATPHVFTWRPSDWEHIIRILNVGPT